MTRRLPLLLLPLLLVPACGGGGGGGESAPSDGGTPAPKEDFLFETTRTVAYDLAVELDGAPRPYARIQLQGAADPEALLSGDPSVPHEVFFDGATTGAGRATGVITVDVGVQAVDLVVQVAGASGDYTHQELRAAWGPFAPSSRVRIELAELDGFTSDLFSD